MKLQKKHLAKITVPVLALGFVITGANMASAHGMGGGEGRGPRGGIEQGDPSTMFTKQASLLGVSVDEVKTAWASGKDIMTLAKEKGISEQTLRAKMDAQRESDMKEHLASEVKSGKITQAQADEIIANQAKRETEMKQTLATALGITTTQLDAYKAAGKTPEDIIKEKGLNADTVHTAIQTAMKSARLAEETTRIQALVTKGVLTQDQANKRIEIIKTMKDTKGITKQGIGRGGKGKGPQGQFNKKPNINTNSQNSLQNI